MMTTMLQRPEELRKGHEDFHEFLEAHDELDTLAGPEIPRDTGPRGPSRGRWLAAAFAMIALVIAAIVVGIVADFGGETTKAPTEDEVLAQLVARGYVPAEALSPMTYWTNNEFAPRSAPNGVVTEDQVLAQLVARGYVPAEALSPVTYWTNHSIASTGPSLTTEQLATMDLVANGLLPADAAQAIIEAQATIDLVNRGLVPAETLGPAVPPA